jgi:hypothetical protein
LSIVTLPLGYISSRFLIPAPSLLLLVHPLFIRIRISTCTSLESLECSCRVAIHDVPFPW